MQQILKYKNFTPKIDETVFLAPGCKIIGDVTILKDSSVWYNVVVRGDVNFIKIGEMTNIQDLSMLHVTLDKFGLSIGNNVTIGHSVNLHGCTVQDNCLIGIGAIVLDGAVLEENCFVAAGALVPPGMTVPKEKLVAGIPAKIIRNLSLQEIKEIELSAIRYKKYSELTRQSF